MNTVTKEVEQGYQKVINVKDRQIAGYEQSYVALKSTLQQSIEEQNKLQVAYVKLQDKQRKVKRWRNVFMGASAVLAGVLVLVVK